MKKMNQLMLAAIAIAAPSIVLAAGDAAFALPESTFAGLLQALSALVLTGLAVAVGFGCQWLKRKSRNVLVAMAADWLQRAVETAVPSVHQTYAEALKEASKDGKLTPEEHKTALNLALETVKSLLGMRGSNLVMSVNGVRKQDFDGFLRPHIEMGLMNFKERLEDKKSRDKKIGMV